MSDVNLNDVKGFLSRANGNSPISEKERQKIIKNGTKAFERFLDALGFNWRDDPNSSNTPQRFTKAFVNDLAKGCYMPEPDVTAFPNNERYDGMVFQGGIPMKSMCSHHLLPFTGKVHVAYIPDKDGKVIGLSKLNRIVEFYACRPQIQEGLTMQISNAIDKVCEGNHGVAVFVEAQHTCVCLRGIKHDGCSMKTSRLTGDFLDDAATREEFYHSIARM